MGTLERTLEDDIARRAAGKAAAAAAAQSRGDYRYIQDSDSDSEEQELEPTVLAVPDTAYDEDGDDDLVDLGFQVGKMRISERIGGFVRPRLPQEVPFPSVVY
jgi:hypothetical protein